MLFLYVHGRLLISRIEGPEMSILLDISFSWCDHAICKYRLVFFSLAESKTSVGRCEIALPLHSGNQELLQDDILKVKGRGFIVLLRQVFSLIFQLGIFNMDIVAHLLEERH
jgi:hypothetical protein